MAIRCFSSSSASNQPAEHGVDIAAGTPRLTHIDESGHASMVDVAHKESTRRTATASGRIIIPRIAFELITQRPDHEQHDGSEADQHESAHLRTAKAKARAKGDALTVAQLAAIMGCKRTPELIPLCHPLQLSHIAVTLHPEVRRIRGADADADGPGDGHGDRPVLSASASFAKDLNSDLGDERSARAQGGREEYSVVCRATVSCEGKTGVEMEALTAVSVGLLTVWDMLKAVAGREMVIRDVLVEHKAGGKSGDFVRGDR